MHLFAHNGGFDDIAVRFDGRAASLPSPRRDRFGDGLLPAAGAPRPVMEGRRRSDARGATGRRDRPSPPRCGRSASPTSSTATANSSSATAIAARRPTASWRRRACGSAIATAPARPEHPGVRRHHPWRGSPRSPGAGAARQRPRDLGTLAAARRGRDRGRLCRRSSCPLERPAKVPARPPPRSPGRSPTRRAARRGTAPRWRPPRACPCGRTGSTPACRCRARDCRSCAGPRRRRETRSSPGAMQFTRMRSLAYIAACVMV